MLIKSYLFTLNLSLCSSALNGSFFFFWESKKIRADLISQNLVSGVKIFPGLFSAISWNVERLKQSWKISAAAFWPFRARSLFLMDQPWPLFHLFLSFQTHISNYATNAYVKKCPSSIWCQDSNSQPLEHESPPITTRPGLLPRSLQFYSLIMLFVKNENKMEKALTLKTFQEWFSRLKCHLGHDFQIIKPGQNAEKIPSSS